MNSKKPPPLIARAKHDACPVCGEISYSVTGVHPQCAMRQADQARLRENEGKPVKPAATPVSGLKPWERTCPKCKTVQHVRKKTCACGHIFPQRMSAPQRDEES